jgi:acetyl esterase
VTPLAFPSKARNETSIMNKNLLGAAALLLLSSFAAAPAIAAESFTVTLDAPTHGKFELSPALPTDGKYPAGTVVTVSTQPDPGYTLDAGYYSVPGQWGAMYHESMTPVFKVTIDRDKHIGASFIEKSAVAHIDVKHDIVYAKPGVKPLKYDVFTPKGAKQLPIIVIIHGGGWVTNDENVMRGLARELTRGGKFVVASIDYRWAGKADGDATNNTMANLIEDVFGAVAHIMEHAKEYGGDASRILLTGDSAGGHLSASGSLLVDKIGDRGFGKTAGVFEFKPTYLPKGKSAADVRKEMLAAIKAAAPSYGVFDGPWLNHYSENPAANETWQAAISPARHIPKATDRAVPQYLTRGTRDPLIQDEMCKSFMEALVNAGQRVEYVQVGGAQHAFFDWKPDAATKATFKQYGVYYAAEMKAFFESVL